MMGSSGRVWLSTVACRTHLRSVSADPMPSRPAPATIAGQFSVSLETHADLLNGAGLAPVSFTASFQPAGVGGATPPPPASGAGAVNTFWKIVPIGTVAAGASYLQAQSWATMMAADNTAAVLAETWAAHTGIFEALSGGCGIRTHEEAHAP